MIALVSAIVLAGVLTDAASKEQFYRDVASKQYTIAVQEGRPYLQRHPEDAAYSLDYAYALCNAGRAQDARAILIRLAVSENAAVAAAARSQLTAIGPAPAAQRALLLAYVEPDTRYGDTFYGLQYRKDLTQSLLRPFLAVDLTSDTRSGAPRTSPIYNTDEIFASAGLRTKLAPGLEWRIQAGPSIGLRGQRSVAEVRSALSYWGEFGAGRTHAHTSIGATAVYSSRFAGNVIAYSSALHDFHLVSGLRAVAGFNAGIDTQRQYYNNFAEVVAGVQYAPAPGTIVRYEYVRGGYLPSATALPASRTYGGVRAVVWFATGGP